ncbi:MAG TPA: hypothetical protein VKA95_02615 [Nitrososphaeraceae archaeon]|jgi:hypothetical protein|nr:hypothetical protein [Nitrososphaeraceae archaeon]
MNKSYTGPNIADILELVESVPINNKLEAEIDAKFPLENNNNNRIAERVSLDEQKISFRDIISLLIDFIKGIYSSDENVKSSIRLDKLRKIGCTYPAQYLLFDFCLAALEGDLLDAKLFLGHAFNIIGLSNQLNLLLSAIVYTPLTSEKEVRELLTLLALEVQPANMEAYLQLYGKDFQKRHQIYENEIMKLKF